MDAPVITAATTAVAATNPFQGASMPVVVSALVVCGLLALLVITALALVKGLTDEREQTRAPGKSLFYTVALLCGALQLLAWPLPFLLLPAAGRGDRLFAAIGLSLLFLLPALWWMWQELRDPTSGAGRRFWHICGSVTLAFMFFITARVVHGDEVAYAYAVAHPPAAKPATPPVPVAPPEPVADPGKPAAPVDRGLAAFNKSCFLCHNIDTRKIGPPLTEAIKDYIGNPDGIVAWAKKPGKKRPDYPQMLPILLPDDEIRAAAEYILKVAGEANAKAKK